MKKAIYLIVLVLIIAGGIVLANYLTLNRPVQTITEADSRNKGIELNAHYQYYVSPGSLVINLNKVSSTNAPVDVFRALMQASQALKNKTFKEVILASKGDGKFKIKGAYFKQLGETSDTENPLYLVRTLPENVLNLDGSTAYNSLDGGVLGVMAGQMDQFNDFSQKWCGAAVSTAN